MAEAACGQPPAPRLTNGSLSPDSAETSVPLRCGRAASSPRSIACLFGERPPPSTALCPLTALQGLFRPRGHTCSAANHRLTLDLKRPERVQEHRGCVCACVWAQAQNKQSVLRGSCCRWGRRPHAQAVRRHGLLLVFDDWWAPHGQPWDPEMVPPSQFSGPGDTAVTQPVKGRAGTVRSVRLGDRGGSGRRPLTGHV